MYIKISSSWTTSCYQLEKMWKDADTCYFGVRTRVWITNEARLRLLSHVFMRVLTQLVCGRPKTYYITTRTCIAWSVNHLLFLQGRRSEWLSM
jgi:hypothetical protein